MNRLRENPCGRHGLRRLVAAAGAMVALLVGCDDSNAPMGPEPGFARLAIHMSVSSTVIGALAIEVTADDIETPLIFNLPVENGMASGTIDLPVGSARTITICAFNSDGIETHRGSATVDIVEGENPTLMITLEPLSGSLPIEVQVGSFVVTVDPAELNLAIEQQMQVNAVVTDVNGDEVDREVTWGSANPAIATVDETGLVTGIAVGTTEIVASSGSAAAAVIVNVTEMAAVQCAEDNGGITLPDGFCAAVVADGLGSVRHMALTPAGDLYVAVNPAGDGSDPGQILALRDADGDGQAEQMETLAAEGGNGIAWRDGTLYVAHNDRIVAYDLPSGELLPAGEAVEVVGDLPADRDHVSKTIVLENGSLFVNIGSASNSCQEENRAVESPGVDPCPELDVRAGVWVFDANVTGQTQTDGMRFATGLRNMVALAAKDGSLFGVQNGRDQLFENWPALFTEEDDATLPSEEFFLIEEQGDYGWPYCYHDPIQDQKVLAPEYGGDGMEIGRCADVGAPLVTFGAHAAPLGMVFYTGEQFPDRYVGGAFIAFHGSRFVREFQDDPPGYDVQFVPFDGTSPTGDAEVFADGFAGEMPTPDGAVHRPVGLAQGPDGSLYISDDQGGRIWRVIFTGTN